MTEKKVKRVSLTLSGAPAAAAIELPPPFDELVKIARKMLLTEKRKRGSGHRTGGK